jgi:hypothetical protein
MKILQFPISEVSSLLHSYPEEEIHDFFYLMLGSDTVFFEYIGLRLAKFGDVKEMTGSPHMMQKKLLYNSGTFSTRHSISEIRRVKRAKIVLNELTTIC